MLLKETKLRLLDLFTSFAEEEKDLEQLRQNLCETACFEPYIAFRRIDSSNLGFLSTSNLLEFLSSYNFFHNHQNIQFYINHYDQDYDKKLSYSEFLQSVLPLDNSELRFSISQRPIKKLEDFNEGIIQKIEKKLAFLINREINFYIKFEKEKLNLISYSNFDIFHIFQSLALRDREEIGFEDLKVFFFKNSFEIKDNDILLILRRIDLNGDGKIEFHEFENAFLPKTKFVKEKENKDLNQPKGGRIQNFQTSRQFEDKRDFFSKSFNVTSNSKMFNFKNIGFNEHIQSVLGIFNYYLKIEKIYEDLKQELAMREDFNLFDLFNCFDKLGQGFILTSELEYRLNDIQMHPDKNELLAFINILNLKVEGKIKLD